MCGREVCYTDWIRQCEKISGFGYLISWYPDQLAYRPPDKHWTPSLEDVVESIQPTETCLLESLLGVSLCPNDWCVWNYIIFVMFLVLSKLDFTFHAELKTDQIKPNKEHAKSLNYIYIHSTQVLPPTTHTHMYTLSQTTTGCMKKLLYFLRKGIACTSHFIVFTKNKVNQIWMQNIIETSNIYTQTIFSPLR